MIYKKFGNTGKEISVIGMGGMRLNWEDKEDGVSTIVEAYKSGINYFDSAEGYGGGKSEEYFGEAIKEMKKLDGKPFYISTKAHFTEPVDGRKCLETSLKRLDVDCIDFYHMWYICSIEDFNKRKKERMKRQRGFW